MRYLHVVHLLIRENLPGGQIGFLSYLHEQWTDSSGKPYLALPAKKTVAEPLAEFIQGSSLDVYIDHIAKDELKLPAGAYTIDQEIEAVEHPMPSPTQRDEHGQPRMTHYTVYPVELWVAPEQREPLRKHLNGRWLTCDQALGESQLSPTARKVFEELKQRHAEFQKNPPEPEKEKDPRKSAELRRMKLQAEALRRLFSPVSDRAGMDALAKEWLSQNLRGVRHLDKKTLDEILDVGDRAFNLRVADPYLRYQMQGQGFTWSFFTHKDKQDCHVHGAPIVEIYGILEGEMEIWSKPYYERGTSAWSHRNLKAGDWLEVDALQCHIVHWLGKGKGVVFKAGPGPLAEVGKLGVKGKTPCADCPCMKPSGVLKLENAGQK
jgi:mannose-6-phosphate isomerase-like protein (cupin superfamily)